MEAVLGIDVGGTSIKAGLFTPSGELLEERKIPTPELVTEEAYGVVTSGIEKILAAHDATPSDVIACGLDIPGPVADDGTVGVLANIKLDPEGMVGALTAAFPNATVAFINDANAAALGEMWAGVAQQVSSYVLIALGTGVGAGVVANGKLVAGAFGAGGEIGHITVNPHETAVCGCGKRGCLEQYSSATGVVRCMKKLLEENPDVDCVLRGKDFEAKDVFDAARSGDALAAREVEEMSNTLGMALANIASTTDPEMFLVGGGVARAGDVLFDPLVKHFKEYAFRSCRETPIKSASLGNDAGIYGAVRLIVGE